MTVTLPVWPIRLAGYRSPVPKYEYKIVNDIDRAEEMLNDLAAEGWRLVHVVQASNGFDGPKGIMEREVRAPAE